MAVSDPLAERYGRSRGRGRRPTIVLAGFAAAFVLAFVAWLAWTGFGGAEASVTAHDTAYHVIDEHTIRVDFTVSADPGSAVSCAVQSLDTAFAVIGWKVVSYPPSTSRTNAHSETLRTTQAPNTGLIYRCWLT